MNNETNEDLILEGAVGIYRRVDLKQGEVRPVKATPAVGGRVREAS